MCKEQNIPAKERAFLEDQRSLRKLFISTVYLLETKKLQKKSERKEKQLKAKRLDETVKESTVTEPIESTSSADYSATSESEDEFLPSTSFEVGLQKSQQMRLELSTLARTSDRYGLSDRAVQLWRLQYFKILVLLPKMIKAMSQIEAC